MPLGSRMSPASGASASPPHVSATARSLANVAPAAMVTVTVTPAPPSVSVGDESAIESAPTVAVSGTVFVTARALSAAASFPAGSCTAFASLAALGSA